MKFFFFFIVILQFSTTLTFPSLSVRQKKDRHRSIDNDNDIDELSFIVLKDDKIMHILNCVLENQTKSVKLSTLVFYSQLVRLEMHSEEVVVALAANIAVVVARLVAYRLIEAIKLSSTNKFK